MSHYGNNKYTGRNHTHVEWNDIIKKSDTQLKFLNNVIL